MGTTAEKLQAIIDSKEAIRQAIVDKGVSCDNTVPLDEYATKIGDISGGGGSNVEFGDIQITRYYTYSYNNVQLNLTRINISNPTLIPILEFYEVTANTQTLTPAPDGVYTGYYFGTIVMANFEILTVDGKRYLKYNSGVSDKDFGWKEGTAYIGKYLVKIDYENCEFSSINGSSLYINLGVATTTTDTSYQYSRSDTSNNYDTPLTLNGFYTNGRISTVTDIDGTVYAVLQPNFNGRLY